MFRLTSLDRQDREAITQHLLRLTPADRRQRFMAMCNDDFIRRYVAGLAPERDLLIGAFDASCLVGLAHVATCHGGGESDITVEVGLSVQADMRRRGLGRQLCASARASATAAGARRMVLHFASANHAMAALMRKLGAAVVVQGCEAVALLDLHRDGPPPAALQQRAGRLVSSFRPLTNINPRASV